MAVTHSHTLGWSKSGAAAVQKTFDVSDDVEVNVDTTLTASQSNKQIDLAIDVSEVSSLFMVSSVDCVVKTNSTGSPDATITLVANEPLPWHDGWAYTNPLGSVDVTVLYVTNSDAEAGTFQMFCLVGA